MIKLFRNYKQKRDAQLVRHTAGLLGTLLEKVRLRERIAQADRWAERHPVRTLCWTVGLLSLFLTLGILLSLRELRLSNEDTYQKSAGILGVDGIADIRPVFDGFHRIQNAKSYQDSQVTGLIGDGQRLRRDLDSLVALPHKTHADSAAIVVKYHQLEYIVKQIKKEKNETE